MPDPLSSATDDNRVVSLHTRRKVRTSDSAPGALSSADLGKYERSPEPDDFRHRMTVNVVAFVFLVGLVFAGVWLADTITTMRKTQDCVLTGKRGCGPIEVPAPVR